jgi:hypothetical protein
MNIDGVCVFGGRFKTNRPYSFGDHDAGWRQQAYTVGVDRFDRPAPAGSAMPMRVGDDTAIP